MKLIKEKKIVHEIIKSLRDKSGFNDWWENIDTDTKNEIIIKLVRIVNSKVETWSKSYNYEK